MAIQADGPLSKYTASHDTPPFRYTKEDQHVRCRTSGAYEPPDRLPMRDSISETAHIRCILGAAYAFWQKEARSARYVPVLRPPCAMCGLWRPGSCGRSRRITITRHVKYADSRAVSYPTGDNHPARPSPVS